MPRRRRRPAPARSGRAVGQRGRAAHAARCHRRRTAPRPSPHRCRPATPPRSRSGAQASSAKPPWPTSPARGLPGAGWPRPRRAPRPCRPPRRPGRREGRLGLVAALDDQGVGEVHRCRFDADQYLAAARPWAGIWPRASVAVARIRGTARPSCAYPPPCRRLAGAAPLASAACRAAGLVQADLRKRPAEGKNAMDFAYTEKVEQLRARLRHSSTSTSIPTRRATTRRWMRSAARATLAGLAADRGAQAAGARRRAVEHVPAARATAAAGHLQPRLRAAVRDDGPRLLVGRGVQLLGARHRQHGDHRALRHRGAEGAVARAAARRRDPLGLR